MNFKDIEFIGNVVENTQETESCLTLYMTTPYVYGWGDAALYVINQTYFETLSITDEDLISYTHAYDAKYTCPSGSCPASSQFCFDREEGETYVYLVEKVSLLCVAIVLES